MPATDDTSFEQLTPSLEQCLEVLGEPIFSKRRKIGDVVIPRYTDPNVSQGWSTYAEGYKTAGDLLVAMMTGRHDYMPRYADDKFLIYAVLFVYRHSIELALKELLDSCGYTTGQSLDKISHSLVELLNRSLPVMKEAIPDFEQDDPLYPFVRARLAELDKLDTASQGFRYPVDTRGKPTLASLGRVNLQHLWEVMNCLYHYLDGASTGVYEYGRHQNEMRSYEP